jgi:hypothetical protein
MPDEPMSEHARTHETSSLRIEQHYPDNIKRARWQAVCACGWASQSTHTSRRDADREARGHYWHQQDEEQQS